MKKYRMTLETLQQAQEAFCHGPRISCCMDCPLQKAIHELQLNTCNDFIKYYPDKAAKLMGLEVVEEVEVAEDINALGKAVNPRLAEILGVNAGEKFQIPINGSIVTFEITGDGHFETTPPNIVGSTYLLLEAIERPEIIIRQSRITPEELAICKAVGAKWLCMDDAGFKADLWNTKPSKTDKGIYVAFGVDPMARLQPYVFPSLKPGDCINVEELMK